MIHQPYAQRSQNTEFIDTQPPKAVANAPKARLPQYRILLSARVSRAGEATTQQLRLTSSFYCTHTSHLTPSTLLDRDIGWVDIRKLLLPTNSVAEGL